MTCSSTGCSAVPTWTMPVSAAATASAGVTVRTSRLRALRAIAGSTTVQLPRSRSSGAAPTWPAGPSPRRSAGRRAARAASWKLNSASVAEAGRSRSWRLARPTRPRPVEHGGRGQVAAQAARPEHVDPARRPARRRRRSSRLTSSSVSSVIWSGTRSSSSRSSTGQASAAAAQRDRGVGARPVAEAVLVGVVGPQHRGVAEVQRVLLVVDLEHQPHRAGDQLLLVGLDPQRDPHQLGQVVGPRLGVAPEPVAQPLLERAVAPPLGAAGPSARLAASRRRPRRARRGRRPRPRRPPARRAPARGQARTRSSSSAVERPPSASSARCRPARTSRPRPAAARAARPRTAARRWGAGRRGCAPW